MRKCLPQNPDMSKVSKARTQPGSTALILLHRDRYNPAPTQPYSPKRPSLKRVSFRGGPNELAEGAEAEDESCVRSGSQTLNRKQNPGMSKVSKARAQPGKTALVPLGDIVECVSKGV